MRAVIRRIAVVALAFALAALWCACATASSATDPPISVAVVPSPAAVSALNATEADVVVTNASTQTYLVTSQLITNNLVNATPADTEVVAAGTSTVWHLHLQRAPGAQLPGTALVETQYTPVGGTGSAATAIITALPLIGASGESADSIVALTTDSGTATVDDVHESQTSIVIANKSGDPVEITGIDASAPTFIHVAAAGGQKFPLTIAARSSAVVMFDLQARGAIQRGTVQIAFTAHIAWGPGLAITGGVTASQHVNAGAFGESDIGTVLQLPTLLLAPGVVVLLAISLAWRVGLSPLPRADRGTFALGVKDGEFWVIAILISAAGIFGYWLTTSRLLLGGYGSQSIVVLTGISVAVGLALWTIWCAVPFEHRRRRRISLAPGTPLDVLTALARRPGASLRLPIATQTWGDGHRLVLLPNGLPAQAKGTDPILVCPPLQLSLCANATVPPSAPQQQAERDLCDALARRDGSAIKAINQILTENSSAFVLDWRTVKGLSGLEAASAADLKATNSTAPLIVIA